MKAGIFRNTATNGIAYISNDQRILAHTGGPGITDIHEPDNPQKVSYFKGSDTALSWGVHAATFVRISAVPPEHKGRPYAALKWYRDNHLATDADYSLPAPNHSADAVPVATVTSVDTNGTFRAKLNLAHPVFGPVLSAVDIENPNGAQLPKLVVEGVHVGWVTKISTNDTHTLVQYRPITQCADRPIPVGNEVEVVYEETGSMSIPRPELRQVRSGICHGMSARKHRKANHRVYRIPATNRYYWEH